MNCMLDSLFIRLLFQIIFGLGVKYPFMKDQTFSNWERERDNNQR